MDRDEIEEAFAALRGTIDNRESFTDEEREKYHKALDVIEEAMPEDGEYDPRSDAPRAFTNTEKMIQLLAAFAPMAAEVIKVSESVSARLAERQMDLIERLTERLAVLPASSSEVYTVTLTSSGPNKINVIKAVRESTGAGLAEAKRIVEATPQTIKETSDRVLAEKIAERLRDAGASAIVDRR